MGKKINITIAGLPVKETEGDFSMSTNITKEVEFVDGPIKGITQTCHYYTNGCTITNIHNKDITFKYNFMQDENGKWIGKINEG